MERLRNFVYWVMEEAVFWGEVVGEVIGVDKNKYTAMIEIKQREIAKQQELERKRRLYERLAV